ncbi:MAG: hypothetical protein ACI4D8_04555, partial [Wujia sp.]
MDNNFNGSNNEQFNPAGGFPPVQPDMNQGFTQPVQPMQPDMSQGFTQPVQPMQPDMGQGFTQPVQP